MFRIPTKEIIVNDDSQVQLLSWDGVETNASAAYADGDVAALTDIFVLHGFLSSAITPADLVGANALKISKQDAVQPTNQVMTVTVTSTSAVEGDSFRLVMNSIDGTPVTYQDEPIGKRYQLPNVGDLDSTADIAAAIVAAINADEHAQVTATAASAVVTITTIDTSILTGFFSEKFDSTIAVTTAATLGVNTYDALKNINWSRGFELDRNSEFFPAKGKNYISYTFSLMSTGFLASSGGSIPSEDPASSTTEFTVYAEENTTLAASLSLLTADIAGI